MGRAASESYLDDLIMCYRFIYAPNRQQLLQHLGRGPRVHVRCYKWAVQYIHTPDARQAAT